MTEESETKPSDVPETKTPPLSVSLPRELRRFLATLEAIAELVDLTPSVAALDRKHDAPFNILITAAAQDGEATQREELRRAGREAFQFFLDDLIAQIRRARDAGGERSQISMGAGSTFLSAVERVAELSGGKIDSTTFVQACLDTLNRPRKIPVQRKGLLLRSLLTTCVSAFETLLASIAGGYFANFPGAMGTEENEFSLKALLQMNDISEAVEQAIDRRVDEILRKGFDGQVAWLKDKSRLGVDPSKHVTDMNRLTETMERRHCIVHHGGTVSAQYLKKVSNTDKKIGDRLSVNEDYISNAIADLAEFGVYIALATWRKLQSNADDDIAALIREDGYELLKSGSWKPAHSMFLFGRTLNCRQMLLNIFQVNSWLCIKRMNGLDSIRSEIEQWDTSAMDAQLKFAKLALLDDLDSAMKLAEELVHSESLNLRELLEWPLLEELREHPDFHQRLGIPTSPESAITVDQEDDPRDDQRPE